MSLNKNSRFYFFLLWVHLYGFSQVPLPAQDSILTENLDEVVVSATRTLRQLSSLPLPVTLVSAQQIRRTGVTRLNEILNEQTGILVVPDATIGGGEGVQIQGIASDYVLVLIDGVPVVGRSSGNLDLSRLAVGNIAQVEIVKGPSSSLFGSEALGGVINIITEDPKSETISGQLAHRAASFNNQNTSLNLGQKAGPFSYGVFLDRLSTDGFDLAPGQEGQTVNPFVNYTLNGRVRWQAGEKLKLLATGRYFSQEFDISPSNSEETDFNLLLRAEHDPSERFNVQYEFYFTRYTTNENALDPLDETLLLENDFDQRLLRPEVRLSYSFTPGNTLTTGAGMNFERLERSLFSSSPRFDSQYIFAQYDFTPLRALNLILGARFDHHSEYNSQFSPKASARYDLSRALSLKASVGSGFKAPDFRQLYLDFTNASGGGYSVMGKEVEAAGIRQLLDAGQVAGLAVPLEDLGERLDAERSVGINLGLRYQKGKWTTELNFFRNDFRNLIDTRILATKTNGQGVFGYLNREEVFTQGAELDLRIAPLENLSVSAGYQLLFAYDKEKQREVERGEVFVRDPETLETVRLGRPDYFGLENRSRHSLNLKAFYELPSLDAFANLRVVYRSRFGLTDRNGNDLLDVFDDSFVKGYALVNLAFGKTFFDHYELQFGANNLLDFKGNNPLAAQDSELLVNPGIQLFARVSFEF
ncbi:TonB-dependent receptor plug domain-containing protein [Robiginitalea marina]|uniref:TonB-dependent receptor n=1 Tax=Robiginitalea marina TaxID=2954105 RepID=A0ABT1AYN6_9FLAO|nr:TonB-dependent receptor [Robiginitalea marina]MCO5725146.1 TonB-dependent receptor [Robiginitalea marina]